jgi:hypothetical protein
LTIGGGSVVSLTFPGTLFSPAVETRAMHRVYLLGLALSVGGLVGYLVGLGTAYPGRALSVTVLMVGLTVAAVGHAMGSEVSP